MNRLRDAALCLGVGLLALAMFVGMAVGLAEISELLK